jgi:hypothetical protein
VPVPQVDGLTRKGVAHIIWNAALKTVDGQKPSTNKQMVAALDDIRAIVFGRGDSVTKVQKVQDITMRLNATKA